MDGATDGGTDSAARKSMPIAARPIGCIAHRLGFSFDRRSEDLDRREETETELELLLPR